MAGILTQVWLRILIPRGNAIENVIRDPGITKVPELRSDFGCFWLCPIEKSGV
jgi:hypothetical protein